MPEDHGKGVEIHRLFWISKRTTLKSPTMICFAGSAVFCSGPATKYSGIWNFQPNFKCLPAPQRRLWDELGTVPGEFVLYGGTAIALYLGHRESVDFDFFGNQPFDPGRY